VDFKTPDIVVSIDIIKDVACCSVLSRYFQYKKYNPGELANLVLKKNSEQESKVVETDDTKDLKNSSTNTTV